MEDPKRQISDIKQQLEYLYLSVEQLQKSLNGNNDDLASISQALPDSVLALDQSLLDLEMTVGQNQLQHKDVLFDETVTLEGHPMPESPMNPDLQIRRLTAQLTVAYKRIAQLEEQLLARHNNLNGSNYVYS